MLHVTGVLGRGYLEGCPLREDLYTYMRFPASLLMRRSGLHNEKRRVSDGRTGTEGGEDRELNDAAQRAVHDTWGASKSCETARQRTGLNPRATGAKPPPGAAAGLGQLGQCSSEASLACRGASLP